MSRVGVTFQAIALLASIGLSSAAQAIDVPYSKGVLTVDDSKWFTIGAGGDFATCREALNHLPEGGGGGVIEYLPGTHVDSCPIYGSRGGNIMITGRLGPNGERPIVTPPTYIDAQGVTQSEWFLFFRPQGNDTLVVQNLEIKDSFTAIETENNQGLIVRNVFVNGTTGGNGITVGEAPAFEGQFETWAEIYDTEIARAGGGNIRHNIYVHRIDEVIVDNMYSHSSNNSHAFKSVARNNVIRDSEFATTDKPFNQILPSDTFLSSTLVDLASCAAVSITNNVFRGVLVDQRDRDPGFGPSTTHMVDLRRRKTGVQGCDTPEYGTPEHDDPAFWAEVAAGGISQSNELLFNHDISGNTFINDGEREIVAVSNWGTEPIEDNGISFGQPEVDLPIPPGWIERSIAWLKNNTTVGDIQLEKTWPTDVTTPLIFNLDELDVIGSIEEAEPPVFNGFKFGFVLYETTPPGEVPESGTLWAFATGAIGLIIFGIGIRRRRHTPG